MVTNLIIVSSLLGVLQFVKINNKLTRNVLYSIFALVFFYLTAFRESGIDRDYDGYVSAYEGDDILASIFEPTFTLFTFLIKNYLNNNVKFLFVFYAIFGVLLKLYALEKLSNFIFASLFLYSTYYFSLHELTQIRIGASCSFFLLSIPWLYNRNAILYFSCITFAFLFHFSAVVLFPLWFLEVNGFNKTKWIVALILSIIFGVLLKVALGEIFNNYSFGLFQQKVMSYSIDNNAEHNVFNAWVFIKISILSVVIYKIDLLRNHNIYLYILVKIYLISLMLYYLFAFNPVFSSRISDILAITEIVIFPTICFIIKPQYIARIIVILFGCSLIFLNLFYNKIIM